ncbi:MAG TPA: glycosyltransferase family 1 protein [Terriglobales bacterium]|nr:glycosyltransferase family 1 protein [Terriglobales bacterium]
MRLFLHALGASAGGGLTYLRNVVPHLAAHPDIETWLLAGSDAALSVPPSASHIHLVDCASGGRGTISRFLWEQREIPRLLRKNAADVLFCAGNFAIWRSPVPQILFSRNSLYTSKEFARDLRGRGDYILLTDTWLKGLIARKSAQRAELNVAPSEAFAQEVRTWARRDVIALHHGFDREQFFQDAQPLPALMQEKLARTAGSVRLLFVSHYNYYRNFETLLRGFALLKQRRQDQKVSLVLTCELEPGKNPGRYRTEGAKALVRELGIGDQVVQLGAVPYPLLHHVYRSCDVYVTPAYTETFAHPLVEAMASGLPIVASDLAVHREIAGDAALFFDRFSPEDLADKVAQVIDSSSLQAECRTAGLRQIENFSWKVHVEKVIELAQGLTRRSA